MTEYLKGITGGFLKYRYLLKNLVSRDIKVKYRRSALGIAWSILNPLLMMAVQVLVFTHMFKAGGPGEQVVRSTGNLPSFSVYLLSGQVLFNFFSEATNTAMDSILGSSALIKKVYIPKYIFPLEKVIFSLVNTGFSLIALLGVILVTYKESQLSWTAVFFFIPIILMFFFNLGMGLILAALTVFFRDIKHFYGVFVMALNYLTPIFYSENAMFGDNTRNAAIMYYVLRANPLYWYIQMFRRMVVYGYMPTLNQWIFTIGWAIVAVVVGLVIFKKAQDRFILYV